MNYDQLDRPVFKQLPPGG